MNTTKKTSCGGLLIDNLSIKEKDGILSNPAFYINFTMTGETSGVVDKTRKEMREAFEAGSVLIFKGIFMDIEVQAIAANINKNIDGYAIVAYAILEPEGILVNSYVPFGSDEEETPTFYLKPYVLTPLT